MLDARNHGNSPHTQEMSYESMSADVVKFLNDHRISECSIIGHSMGGKTAMITALEHPERVERLIVEDVSPTRAPGTGDIMATVGALCEMDLEKIASKRDAEDLLAKQIPVCLFVCIFVFHCVFDVCLCVILRSIVCLMCVCVYACFSIHLCMYNI